MKCLTSLLCMLATVSAMEKIELDSGNPGRERIFSKEHSEGDIPRFNLQEEGYLDLTALEVASLVLSRIRCQLSEGYRKSSIEIILGLLNSGERTDFYSAITFLKARFVDLSKRDENLELVSSVYSVLLKTDYADSKRFSWGLSTSQELVLYKEGESFALVLSPYEKVILEINHEVPAFWANIELRKDAGIQHTKIQVLDLLNTSIDDAMLKLKSRTQIVSSLENALANLIIIKSDAV